MTPANDNGYVRMVGGGNTNPTLAMLERMHDEISYVDPQRPDQKLPSGGAFTVYVIGGVDPEYVKIGKASDVLARLRSIQTGNPLKLYVHRIFGFEKTSDTNKVEAWAHQDAARLHGRAAGEWFRCGPTDAHDLIAEICEKERIKCRVTTPKIEAQWKLDEPTGRAHLEQEARWRQERWEDYERRYEEKQARRNAKGQAQ